MQPPNKKPTESNGLRQQVKQAGSPQPRKPGIVQTKSAVPAQNVKRPVAPPVYRPQAKPNALQQKAVGPAGKAHPSAPPVYRPQPVPKVLQTKMAASHQPVNKPGRAGSMPVAPPAYRPQAVPKVLQRKEKQTAPAVNSTKVGRPAPPPVYRPSPVPRVLQRKAAGVRAPQPPLATSSPRTAKASAIVQAKKAQSPVIQRLRSNFNPLLPPGLGLTWTPDDTISQSQVDKFVNSLDRKQLGWYESDLGDKSKDTKDQLLARAMSAQQKDPFIEGRVYTVWKCGSCGSAVDYAGIHIGHITNWQAHLRKAGAKNRTEAKIAYNDLNNLRVECATCNVGHAFEQDDNNNFKDVPLKSDFPNNKQGKQKYAEITESYEGVNMDDYDMNDDFIDNSRQNQTILITKKPITLTDRAGINSGLSTTYSGAQVLLTGKFEGDDWVEVRVIETYDIQLRQGTVLWGNQNELKLGEVKIY
jgi:hypothetical protein